MDPVVQAAIVAAVGAIIAAGFGLRSTRSVEKSKREAVESTTAMESVSLQLDSWRVLNTAKDAEIQRQSNVIARLRTELDNLNAELRVQRRETRPSHLRTRRDDHS